MIVNYSHSPSSSSWRKWLWFVFFCCCCFMISCLSVSSVSQCQYFSLPLSTQDREGRKEGTCICNFRIPYVDADIYHHALQKQGFECPTALPAQLLAARKTSEHLQYLCFTRQLSSVILLASPISPCSVMGSFLPG